MDDFLTNVYFWLVIVCIIEFIIQRQVDKRKDVYGKNKTYMDILRIMREEKERKEAIVKRVFSYKYDNIIYEIIIKYVSKGGESILRRERWKIG